MSVDEKWLFGHSRLEPMPLGMDCKPWYKEKLPSKCFAKYKNTQLKDHSSLDGRRWVFVREGLDDFRNGCPPCDNMIIRHPKDHFLPIIKHKVPKPAPKKSPKILQELPEETSLRLVPCEQSFSKVLEDIKRKVCPPKDPSVETFVTKQYFTVYPQIEEGDESEEILLNVVRGPYFEETLNKPRKLWLDILTEPTSHRESFPRAHPVEVFVTLLKKISEVRKHDEQMEKKKKKKKKKPKKKSSKGQCQSPRNIPRVVREFCTWAIALGEKDVNETYVMKLFDIGREFIPVYQTVHIRRIGQVPVELRYNKALNEDQEMEFSVNEINWEQKLVKAPDPYKPTPMKIRYGAWYLRPQLWTKLVNDEPLVESEALLKARGKGRRRPLPDILEDLYGTIAFKDYVLSHGFEMPWILEKLFKKKGWTYDQINTPMKKVLRMYPLLKEDSQEDPSLKIVL